MSFFSDGCDQNEFKFRAIVKLSIFGVKTIRNGCKRKWQKKMDAKNAHITNNMLDIKIQNVQTHMCGSLRFEIVLL